MSNLADELERLLERLDASNTYGERNAARTFIATFVHGYQSAILSALRKPASPTGEGEPVAQDAKDAEITRLRADITGLEDGNMTFMSDELDKAKAENARMREALEKIADGSAPPVVHGHYLAHRLAVDLARQALGKAG